MKYLFEKGNKINLGRKPSIKTRIKMSKARKRFIMNNPINTCFKKGENYWLGKKHTKEELIKMSIAKKGKPCDFIKTKFKKGQNLGENHPNWKGGKYYHSKGYILIYKAEHPFAYKNFILEHRFVIENQIGRYLTPEETSHHLGQKDDNRPEMLMAFVNNSTHRRFHINPNLVKPSEIIFDGRLL